MTSADITRQENEVAAARERLTASTHVVTQSATGAAFKDEVARAVNDVRNDAVTSVQSAGTTWAQTMRDEVVSRANANPLAVAAIVGGVGWKLMRRPPISLLLTAAGLYGLVRTDPRVKAVTAADIVSKGRRLVAEGQHIADEAIQQTKEFGQSTLKSGTELVEEVSNSGRKVVQDLRDQAAKLSDGAAGVVKDVKAQVKARVEPAEVSRSLRKASELASSRDALLLGFAVLAVGAAVGLTYGQSDGADQD